MFAKSRRLGVELKKSFVPREAVRKVEERSLQAFSQIMKRNPSAKERDRIISSVHNEAAKLNRAK